MCSIGKLLRIIDKIKQADNEHHIKILFSTGLKGSIFDYGFNLIVKTTGSMIVAKLTASGIKINKKNGIL